MKRVLSVLLSAIMLIGLCTAMSGCGKDESNTLVWYVPGDSQKDMVAVMEAANKIIEPKLGVKLDLKMLDAGAYSEKMSMMMSANQEFDICFTGYVNPYVSAVRLGAYYPMTELIDKYAPKLKEEIPEYVWDVAYVDNEIYAVPNMQIMTNVEGVFFFEDVAKKYGITSDMTYKDIEELEPIFEKIKNGESDMYPITTMPTRTFYRDYYLIHQSPYMYINKDTKKVFAMTEMPEYQDALAAARKWYEKGYLRSDIDTAASHTEEDLRAGKYASFGGRWKPGIEQDHEKMYGKKTVFISSGISELFGGLDTMTAISKTSKNPEKAMQLIELVNTDKELYNIICYGIEGKHYEKLDGDYIRPIENSGYSQLACWKFGNQFNAFLLEGQEPNVWEETRRVNDEAEEPFTRGFTLNEKPIKSNVAQCNAVMGEYKNLSYGSVSDYSDKSSEYDSRLNTAGQQDIKKEIQSQFDEWYKNKANK